MSSANRLPHVTCPACAGRAFAKTTGKTSALFREVYYHCRNPDACGHVFVVEMVAIRAVRPSRYPKPLHALPMTEWRKAANDRADNDNTTGAPESVAGT
ncbi:ogr/Delta-like zinc finger family protein [Croceibacterium ferulae]|uniref:ogr/Delta-like zinc finger family protein n=1 Tax=Croceibacterium ferulae TaxID=1854641 RepID=UPI000EAE727D|nr:ogr/Delta-like zinc finger family protein [Croceibacterium ferulae]